MDFEINLLSNVSESGELQLNVRNAIKRDLPHFRSKRVQIIIKKVKSQRSVQQNRLWWLYMTILSKDLGYTKEEIHELCKYKFLKREKVFEKTGEIFEYIESTTKLNKMDFSDMTSELIRWSAETFNIILPMPGEQLSIE